MARPLRPFWAGFASWPAGSTRSRFFEPQAEPSVAPVLVAAPHSTYFDGFVVFWTNLPYIVSRVENMKIPLMGRCIALSQAIAVNREDPNSRGNTVKEIIRRAHLHQADNPEERYFFCMGSLND